MKKTIFIIEDELMLADMYKEKMEMAGFEVIQAFDAEEALKKIEGTNPDIILLDILLPRQSGIYFLERIREKEEFKETPVIAFSNFDDSETRKMAFDLGAKDYLIKTNYTPQEILDKVKKYIK
ncbi:MAG: Alkaline phosphatase synthesis transcriptional regulatory protein PhoP [Parcubacteria group bacterium ADurb.Bin247]|jgi:DNA-binding response OmpR family regulator|nr:MAG: Alkaline phosphatase synthesis transcriptional regulatory protein PhoP [Parcubacteria group bacterium ADurb.Bin247]